MQRTPVCRGEYLCVWNCNSSCSTRNSNLISIGPSVVPWSKFDQKPNIVNIWNHSSIYYVLGKTFIFFLWVSGDWQEVERNITQLWYENTRPRDGEIMRKRKFDWWTLSVDFQVHWKLFCCYDPLSLPFMRFSIRENFCEDLLCVDTQTQPWVQVCRSRAFVVSCIQ